MCRASEASGGRRGEDRHQTTSLGPCPILYYRYFLLFTSSHRAAGREAQRRLPGLIPGPRGLVLGLPTPAAAQAHLPIPGPNRHQQPLPQLATSAGPPRHCPLRWDRCPQMYLPACLLEEKRTTVPSHPQGTRPGLAGVTMRGVPPNELLLHESILSFNLCGLVSLCLSSKGGIIIISFQK